MADASVKLNGPSKGSSVSAKLGNNMTANAELCGSCNKRVYLTERIGTGQAVYHRVCFRCTFCKKTLTLGQYTVGDSQPYCKTHYERIFKEGGGRYKFEGSPVASAGSTPYTRQRSTDIVLSERVFSPVATSGGVTSPVLFSPTRSTLLTEGSVDSDSVGNVKRLGAFAATRAMFENSSFGSPTSNTSTSGSPAMKPVTPSGYVREMRAKREAACQPSEVVNSPLQSPPMVQMVESRRYSNGADIEDKTDAEEKRQLARQDVEDKNLKEIEKEAARTRDRDVVEQLKRQESNIGDDDDYVQLVNENKEEDIDDDYQVLVEGIRQDHLARKDEVPIEYTALQGEVQVVTDGEDHVADQDERLIDSVEQQLAETDGALVDTGGVLVDTDGEVEGEALVEYSVEDHGAQESEVLIDTGSKDKGDLLIEYTGEEQPGQEHEVLVVVGGEDLVADKGEELIEYTAEEQIGEEREVLVVVSGDGKGEEELIEYRVEDQEGEVLVDISSEYKGECVVEEQPPGEEREVLVVVSGDDTTGEVLLNDEEQLLSRDDQNNNEGDREKYLYNYSEENDVVVQQHRDL